MTGGLACGKSSVCRFFKEAGAYVVSADEIVHQLLSSDHNLGQRVVSLLGEDVIVNKQINRSKVAQKVFQDYTLLKELEDILHPATKNEIENTFDQIKNSKDLLFFVAEVPLLFEAGWQDFFDHTVAVVCDENTAATRFEQTTGYPRDEYSKRMRNQLKPKQKAQNAEFVIFNTGSLGNLQQETYKVIKQLMHN